MKPLKILFVGCSTFHVNATLFRLFMVRHLIDQGHEVHLLLEDSDVNRRWVLANAPGAHVHYQRVGWFPGLILERKRIIQRLKPDFVHILGVGMKNVLTMSSLSGSSCQFIADFDELTSSKVNSVITRLLHRRVERGALRHSSRTLCASRFLCDCFADEVKDAGKLVYLPYGYEPLAFEACESGVETIKARIEGRRLAVYMGMLSKAYQADEVLHVAEVMKKRANDMSFMVIGGGRELEKYRKRVHSRNLADFVELPGYVLPEQVPAYLLAADVLLFPIEDTVANRARCPNKMFQYIGANKPIVTNRVGEVGRILDEYGRYYDFNDIEDFADKIEHALDAGEAYDASPLMNKHTWKKRAEEYISAISVAGTSPATA